MPPIAIEERTWREVRKVPIASLSISEKLLLQCFSAAWCDVLKREVHYEPTKYFQAVCNRGVGGYSTSLISVRLKPAMNKRANPPKTVRRQFGIDAVEKGVEEPSEH
jgi:hypothetical protein